MKREESAEKSLIVHAPPAAFPGQVSSKKSTLTHSRPVSGLAGWVKRSNPTHRLPMIAHSDLLIRLHLLTVAGAAQAWGN